MTPHRWLLGLGLALGGLVVVEAPAGAGVLDATWNAPTTNTDGSELIDLGSYRVYYGPTTAPCPGASFFPIAAPTPNPLPGTTMNFRLTGLVTGTLYHVSVTAVDLSGNESACSATASGVAQAPFSVSPPSNVNFGSVSLGNFAERSFTVRNTRSGSVSGTVSTAAPFSVVTGSPFTLEGAGASQTVTVRFSPMTAATATANVSFTAGGDSVMRAVTGIGTSPPDTSRPTVTITAPTAEPTYSTTRSLVTLRGTAADNVGVSQVTWVNSQGGSGTATGTTSWTASGIVSVGPTVTGSGN